MYDEIVDLSKVDRESAEGARDGHEESDANRRPCFEKVKCITLETEHEIVFNVKNIFISLDSEAVLPVLTGHKR